MSILCRCILLLTLASPAFANIKMQRNLSKAGFHRDIETLLHLPKSFVNGCVNSSLMIFETLSAGIYADPFQLKSQEQFGGPQVYFGQSVDIEAAEFSSRPLELYIFLDVSSFSHEVSKDVMETRVVLPIHARYHQATADPDTHVTVMILNPGLYTNCSLGGQSDTHTLSAPCNIHNPHSCVWSHLAYESASSHLTMTVPVGQARHKPLVIIGTLLISVVVSAVLIKVIMSNEQISSDKIS